ncbi:lipopolysaccharide kinase (Kdo/WaaP) family protein [Pseudomonas sp. AG1028]|uniref:lipopolysaccharide kinase InaA family protein n=1 Tax=Pseudomonas sp. AG1028 TaxID=2572911 RepID=UPI0011ACEE11|nr:lipopolysaccharide kinase InaA family protein [Pseudomonas sp. AG1028]TWE05336.1 lipopolysaccharide kinase (Kdo/WaaP) family protein [Pseudomonas sp. AG1028]
MATVIGQETATGVNTTFERWWQCNGQWVEPLNQRRCGESGVQLLEPRDPLRPALYSKRQTGHLYRSLSHPLGRPTIMRELQAYQAFAKLGVSVPTLVYGSARKHQGQWQALLITQALTGFINLDQWYEHEHSAAHSACMLNALAGALARMHKGRWQHGCCYAKHIFIKMNDRDGSPPSADIALLDLEKSRRRWRTADASRHDMRQLKRHCGAMPESDWQLLMQAYTAALAA